MFGLLSSTMDRELATETIETFGKHVLPLFDKDPMHSTTRQREAALKAQPSGASVSQPSGASVSRTA